MTADFHTILPDGSGPDEITAAMREMEADGAKRCFLTMVNSDYPMDGRVAGLYLQGYKSEKVPVGGDTLDGLSDYDEPAKPRKRKKAADSDA